MFELSELLDHNKDNEFTCPFNYTHLRNFEMNPENKIVISKIESIYENYGEIFCTGNTLFKHILLKLNNPYNHLNYEGLDYLMQDNPILKIDYYNCFQYLHKELVEMKVRVLSHSFLNFFIEAKSIVIYSDVLNEKGMKLTLMSFENLPFDVIHKVQFSNTKNVSH